MSWPFIVVGAIVGLFVLAAIPLLLILRATPSTPAGPGKVVRAYFEALAKRDADGARALLDVDAQGQIDLPILTVDTLRNPGYSPPRGAEVVVLRLATDKATVLARFDVAAATQELVLTLRRGEGDRERWRIQNALLQLPLPTGGFIGDTLLVAGMSVPADQGRLEAVFSGVYLIELNEHPLREAPPITVQAGNTSVDPLRTRMRSTAREAIEAQVRAYIDACAASKVLDPPGCPFQVGSARPVTNVAWKISQYPLLKLELTSLGEVAVTSTYGEAEARGSTNLPAAPFVRSTAFSVDGAVRAVGGKIVFEPRR